MSDVSAPHGYDDDGKPNAPYGYLKDGVTPRKSNRGARPGQRGNGNRAQRRRPGVKNHSRTDAQRKDALCALGEMSITGPLSALSMSPAIANRFGQDQADALAGDAVIMNEALPALADGLIVLSQSKPGALAWLDQVEEKAPYLLLASVGVQVAKALVTNHLNPNPELARAGRVQAMVRQQEFINAINQQAAEAGITFGAAEEPTVRIPEDQVA